jgi:hypothetical protein
MSQILRNMRVDHRGFHILMPEIFLCNRKTVKSFYCLKVIAYKD